MRSRQQILTPQDVHKQAAVLVQSHLQFQDHGPKCTAGMLLHVLFYAAAHVCSLFAACSRLRDTPSDQALRNALVVLCPNPPTVEQRLNEALAAQLPKSVRHRRWRLAIDLTLIPYHGQAQSDPNEVYRGQAKSGTTHFHAYATCYVVHKGRRFTVAVTRVVRKEPLVDVLKRLLRLASQASVRPVFLLLDRAFYGVAVIRYLQAARYPFIMPVVARGRQPTDPRGASATRVFLAQKRSGWSTYTLSNAQKRTATVGICVHCRNWRGQRNRRGRQTLVYAFWGLQPKTTQWVYQTYRTRFGIETSYRQMHEARIKTTTRNPTLRLLFVGIALLLRNVWVRLHLQVLATPRQGGRKLNLERLRFLTLLAWLAHVAEQALGLWEITVAECPP